MLNSILLSTNGGLITPPTPVGYTLNAASPWYTLQWTNANPNWSTRIYRSVNGGSFTLIHTASPGVSTYSDPTANTYQDNEYYFTHYDGLRESDHLFTIDISSSTLNLSSVSAGITDPGSCPGTGAQSEVTWVVEGNSSGYVVKVEVDEGAGYSTLASGLSVSPSGYPRDLTPLYEDDISGTPHPFTYRISITKSGVHAFNSPRVTSTITPNLATCGA